MELDNGVVVPESSLLRLERGKAYGHVVGLDDDELADPAELERQVFFQDFGPILALPVARRHDGIRPTMDESGGVDWGAFGTVDFERLYGKLDKARYKADKLKEELRRVFIIFSIVKERLPGKAKYLVLKYLRMGVIDLDHIEDWDMWLLARRYLQIRAIRDDIFRLNQSGEQRRCRRAAVKMPWLAD